MKFLKDDKLAVNTWQLLYPIVTETSKFYDLPKIHKSKNPLMPIVSNIGSITYKAAKYLVKILGPLVGKSPYLAYHIKNSLVFVNKIKYLDS